jgi:hypothetical protein
MDARQVVAGVVLIGAVTMLQRHAGVRERKSATEIEA